MGVTRDIDHPDITHTPVFIAILCALSPTVLTPPEAASTSSRSVATPPARTHPHTAPAAILLVVFASTALPATPPAV